MREKTQLSELTSKSDAGDPYSMVDLAFEYISGERIGVDYLEAERLLRLASLKIGEMPLYYILRMLFKNGDPRVEEVFFEKDDWSNPLAYMIYGTYVKRKYGQARAAPIMKRGYEKGNIVCGIFYRLSSMPGYIGLVANFPIILYLIVKYALIKSNDPRDERIRHYKDY